MLILDSNAQRTYLTPSKAAELAAKLNAEDDDTFSYAVDHADGAKYATVAVIDRETGERIGAL